jgi:hypothetical protein
MINEIQDSFVKPSGYVGPLKVDNVNHRCFSPSNNVLQF